MRESLNRICVALLTVAVVVLVALAIVKMTSSLNKRAAQNRYPPGITDGYTANFETVAHDGHLFIVADGGAWGQVIHHPECPCYEKKEQPNP